MLPLNTTSLQKIKGDSILAVYGSSHKDKHIWRFLPKLIHDFATSNDCQSQRVWSPGLNDAIQERWGQSLRNLRIAFSGTVPTPYGDERLPDMLVSVGLGPCMASSYSITKGIAGVGFEPTAFAL